MPGADVDIPASRIRKCSGGMTRRPLLLIWGGNKAGVDTYVRHALFSVFYRVDLCTSVRNKRVSLV